MKCDSIEPRTKHYVREYESLSFRRNLFNKYRKQLLEVAAKTGLYALKAATKKVAHKAVEATGEFTGNKIANEFVKPKPESPISEANSRNLEEVVIPSERRGKY